jgi:hypothetical protein
LTFSANINNNPNPYIVSSNGTAVAFSGTTTGSGNTRTAVLNVGNVAGTVTIGFWDTVTNVFNTSQSVRASEYTFTIT